MDSNSHINEYIHYYLSFPQPPKYALLLNGPWGVGKTFLAKDVLKKLEEQGRRFTYVSLYGLTSLEQIDEAIFASSYPLLMGKATRTTGKLLKSAAKIFNVDVEGLSAQDFLEKSNSEIYIFDDLERCQISITSVMGYINGIVEHDEKKVIIIANEKEIKGEENYARVREKLIGKTFEIRTNLEAALDSFIASIKNEKAKVFLDSQRKIIQSIFLQSGLNNLRILQQSLWDFERVYAALDSKYTDNLDAMTAMLGMLLVLSIEVKGARLSESDLRNRESNAILRYIKNEDPTSFTKAAGRYPEVDLDGTYLSDEDLINVVFKGILNKEEIQDHLSKSQFFMAVGREPHWRTVWHAYDRTEEEFQDAVQAMEEAFQKHEIKTTGELLHVFGIRIWLAKINAIPQDVAAVISECRAYVDAIYASGDIEPVGLHENVEDRFFHGAYDGLGIHEYGTAEFREINDYLHLKRKEAATDQHPHIAENLLEEMVRDPALFLHRVSLTNNENNDYYRIPVLAKLDPSAFVEKLLSLHPSRQRTALQALKSRYRFNQLEKDLSDEKSWAIEVRQLIYDASEKMSPVSKERLQSLLKHGLDESLGIVAGEKRRAAAAAPRRRALKKKPDSEGEQ